MGERAHLPGQDHHSERECHSEEGRLTPHWIRRSVAGWGVAVAQPPLAIWTVCPSGISFQRVGNGPARFRQSEYFRGILVPLSPSSGNRALNQPIETLCTSA